MIVREELRAKAGLVYNVVESIVLAMSVGLMVWLANVVIAHGNELATHRTEIASVEKQVQTIEQHGSRAVETLSGRVDAMTKQLEELKSAIVTLQTAPGELKVINVRLETLVDGQKRMERQLEEHAKANGKNP